MENRSVSSYFIGMVSVVLSLIFLISNFIPFIGPALFGYSLGMNKKRWKSQYNFTNKNAFLIMLFGEIVFCLFLFFVLNFAVQYENKEVLPLGILFFGFVTYLFAGGFYMGGVVKGKK